MKLRVKDLVSELRGYVAVRMVFLYCFLSADQLVIHTVRAILGRFFTALFSKSLSVALFACEHKGVTWVRKARGTDLKLQFVALIMTSYMMRKRELKLP